MNITEREKNGLGPRAARANSMRATECNDYQTNMRLGRI